MVRHISDTGEPRERLVDLKRVKKTDGRSIFDAISLSIEQSGLDINWVTALSFDGGSNFAGSKKGVRAFFPPSVIYCHCRAHALALSMKSAASELCPKINACLDFCSSLYDHFSRSNAKAVALEEAQSSSSNTECHSDGSETADDDKDGEPEPRTVALKLLRPVCTRWLSQGLALTRLLRVYVPLARALSNLEQARDFTSGGLLAFMLKRTNIEALMYLDQLLQGC
ncbi:hypothetical protein FOL47_001270 [Perkinsus chesapeaki]|uniref:Uncharacterized protein n=1 Tax=Perkinsus chesapeaki TaxID=330153 RepID=A0A7J6KUP3_PERCH|nr:hypothetical protein FOL47_001270 [Perkinsus chesapeaki]